MVKEGLKLGLMGGTFNPIHLGHLRAAEEIAGLLGLDRVVFVPSGRPPHKDQSPVIPFAHRLEMVGLATAGRPGFFVSDVEGRRDGPSYTVETLRFFHQRYGPNVELFFITGLDAFLEIHTWKNFLKLFDLAGFVVMSRSGSAPGRLGSFLKEKISSKYAWDSGLRAFTRTRKPPVYFRRVSRLDISSTRIRACLSRGESIRYLVPEQVREYIYGNGLYQPNGQERGYLW